MCFYLVESNLFERQNWTTNQFKATMQWWAVGQNWDQAESWPLVDLVPRTARHQLTPCLYYSFAHSNHTFQKQFSAQNLSEKCILKSCWQNLHQKCIFICYNMIFWFFFSSFIFTICFWSFWHKRIYDTTLGFRDRAGVPWTSQRRRRSRRRRTGLGVF